MRLVWFGPPQSTFQLLVQPARCPGELQVLCASFVPSMIIMMSHLPFTSVWNCGRFQNGLIEFFSVVEPQAPMFVPLYFTGARRRLSARPP